ncbi:MAG: phospholipid carrier-dependent glycosyltransferase [Gemmatimonadaceae bacterium]
MTKALPRTLIWIALSSAAFAASVELLPAAGVRLRFVLLVTAVWFALSLWLGRRALLDEPYRRTVPVFLAASYAILVIESLAAGEDPFSTDRLAAYCAMSVGWASLFLLIGTKDGGEGVSMSQPSRRIVVGLLAAAAITLTVTHALATPRWPLVSDEAIYVLQSEWFFRSGHSWPVPREIADFFVMRKFGYNAEAQHFYGMYPPGWPAMLAAFDAVGLRWWTSVAMGTLTVGLTYHIGTRVHSRLAGLLAAALLAVQQWFIIDHAGYMSDGFATFSAVGGAAALLAAERAATARRRVAWGALAGLALGMGVAARPLSGVALGIALVLWIVLRRRLTGGPLAATLLGVALGGVLPAALLLQYNAATHGDALRLAYQAMHGHGYDLGFGVRGFQVYTPNLERELAPVMFTPADAIAHLFGRLADFAYAAFGIGLLLPVLALARAHRISLRLHRVWPFAVLPALYFFYWYSGIRYYTVLLPFLFIGCAVLLLELLPREPQVTLGMVLAALFGSVYFALPLRRSPGGLDSPWTHSAYFRDPGRQATLDSLASLGARHGPLLVFVRQPDNNFDNLLDRLQLLNADGLASRVLVARDLAARNAELIARYPARRTYLVEDRGRHAVARIVPHSATQPR